MALWILQKIYIRVILRETYASYPYFLITKAVVFLRINSSHSFVALKGGSPRQLSACFLPTRSKYSVSSSGILSTTILRSEGYLGAGFGVPR